MGNEQRPKVQTFLLVQHGCTDKHEQQRQGNTGHDVRVGHGNVGQAHHRLAHFGIQIVNTNRSKSAEACGNGGGQNGDEQGVTQQTQKVLVLEQVFVVSYGEAFKHSQILAGVERSHDQHQHRQVQERKDQDGEDSVGSFHTTTPPSSSSPPKRFIMPVQTSTISISSKLRAAPKLGLLLVLNCFSMMSPISIVSAPPNFWEI